VASHNENTLDPATIEKLIHAPGVADFTTYRGFETSLDGRPAHGAAVTLNQKREDSISFRDARAAEVWPAFAGRDALIVSESCGYRNRVGRGDAIMLSTDRGPHAFDVLGTYSDFASDQGFVLMSRATYERFFDDRGVTSLALFAAAGESNEALVSRLRALVPADQSILIRSNKSLRENSLIVFDRTFAITGVLRLLATIVAFVGVLSALLSLELERAREIGVLRAQGVTPREVRRLVIAETGLVGAIAGLIAIPLGLAVAMVLILVINKRSFGWSLDIEIDPWLFASALAISVFAALLAGAFPAWRMSHSRPALALRGD
jgi:putative ABC transport system permease protein